jgi:predicted GIY-YIG superfamily endonuclease
LRSKRSGERSRTTALYMWHVYILLCLDSSYYIGISNNVEQRFQDHKNGKGGSYTRSHKPVKIVYLEICPNKSAALRREFQIKQWSRKKKEALIAGTIS